MDVVAILFSKRDEYENYMRVCLGFFPNGFAIIKPFEGVSTDVSDTVHYSL